MNRHLNDIPVDYPIITHCKTAHRSPGKSMPKKSAAAVESERPFYLRPAMLVCGVLCPPLYVASVIVAIAMRRL